MDLKDLIAIAWKRRLIVIITIVAAVGAAAALAVTRTNQYQSTETIALTPNLAKGGGVVGANSLETLLPTYALVVQAANTQTAAVAALGHPLDATISAGTTAGTGILRITATSADPHAAASAAQAVSTAFINSKTVVQQPVLTLQVVADAQVPTAPSSPNRPLIVGIGLILGIALGFALALVTDRWFDRVSTEEDVTAATGLAGLGYIPLNSALRGGGAKSLVWNDDPALFRMQEAMRSLRTTLQLSLDDDAQVLQITSPSPGDGKSTVSANLAIAIAKTGMQVTLVDADFWAPRQHLIFGLSNARGLSTLMRGDMTKDRPALQRTNIHNLSVLTTGPLPDNPTEMLAAGIETTIERLRGLGRLIVIDTPPILAVSDTRLIASQADSVVVVVAAGKRKSSVLRAAVEQLRATQSHVAGVVLNGVKKAPGEAPVYGNYYMRPESVSPAPAPAPEPARAGRGRRKPPESEQRVIETQSRAAGK